MDKGFPQKKVLSLVLCVAVMLSVMVMGAGGGVLGSGQDREHRGRQYVHCAEHYWRV